MNPQQYQTEFKLSKFDDRDTETKSQQTVRQRIDIGTLHNDVKI